MFFELGFLGAENYMISVGYLQAADLSHGERKFALKPLITACYPKIDFFVSEKTFPCQRYIVGLLSGWMGQGLAKKYHSRAGADNPVFFRMSGNILKKLKELLRLARVRRSCWDILAAKISFKTAIAGYRIMDRN